ncbi:MAG: RNA polymerase sigma factor RpoD, partial [Lysobacteraceae bacterium]
MKNTAKTLTLTAKKAPAKATAQLAVPKTATSYFLETEAAAKVTVVKTRSRLASAKAALEAGESPAEVEVAANEVLGDEALAAAAAPVEAAVPAAEPAPFDDYTAAVPNAAATVVVRKRGSKLAALKAVAADAPQADAASSAPAAETAETVPAAESLAEEGAAPKAVRTRTRRADAGSSAPAAPASAVGAVSATTDAATLAAIDTSGYLLPQVKVPGRRGRKPSEFVPENDEVAALNTIERAEMKAASKLRERKAKGLSSMLGGETGFSETELEKRRQQIKNLINMGKERGYLTHAQINDQLPENIVDPEAIEGIIATFNDMGIAIYERAPEAEMMLLSDNVPTATSDDEVEAAAATALSTVDSDFGRTTDPVRMYMREMGAVSLLTREGEIEIAKRIEDGLKDMVQAISACPTTISEIIALSHKIAAD